jgi:hypothetical protein
VLLRHSVPFDGLASGDLDAVLSRCRLLEVDAERELLTEGYGGVARLREKELSRS